MSIAYLMNTYPLPSTTFIRREIEALETLGEPIKRFAVRLWDRTLIDPADRDEQHRTEYLLTRNARLLVIKGVLDSLRAPGRLLKVLPLWWGVAKASGGLVKPLGYLLQAMQLRRRAEALGIRHIHAHFSTNAATVAMLAHQLGGPSYSFTVHGPDELEETRRNLLALKVAGARFVVAITDYCRSVVEREAPEYRDKVVVIRCGLNLEEFRPSPVAADDPPRFVCVGRLCENKAQTLIPTAVALVRDDFPDIVVDLVGDGDLRSSIESSSRRLGVESNVRLHGWASASEVRRHITASRALVLPSLAEGLPIVLMEALALGRPVLTTTIAGIPELVDPTCGWIFPPGSAEALADALRAALRSSRAERQALSQEGRRRVEAHHDIRLSAALLLEQLRLAADRPL